LTVLRLSTKDLQSLARATISPGKIISVADRFLISERPENGGNRKYVLPSLQPANPEAAPISTFTKSQPVRRLADGWLLDGVLWDESLRTPRLLLSPLDFVRPSWTTPPRTGTIVAAPILHGYAIHARSGSPPNPRNWRLDRARYSPYVPAILTLNTGRGKTRLNFADYASGRILRTVTLCEGSSPRKALLATTPDWILVTLDGKTFITTTENEQDPIAIPFRIQPRQSTLVLSAVEPVDVSYHAQDATKFELELPGIRVGDGFLKQQSRTGKFTIDLTAAVPEIVKRFHDVHNVLPPRALTDDAGQPRLSWRVLLLREMGYGELFSLFRFDEPWNSDHNRSLIAAMPDCLAIDIPLATAGRTTLMTICSPLSAMHTDGPSTMRNFGGEGSSTVVFVEAVASRAAQWTKPVDLGLYEFADPLSVAHARNDRVLVGLLGPTVLEIPADTSPDDWRFAINRGDRRRLFEHDQP
jgi:hypothetical protein